MKYLLFLFLSTSSTCMAKEYQFTFNVPSNGKINTLRYKIDAEDRWKALEKAGLFCGTFFGVGQQNVLEEQALKIIDACANPRFD